MKTIKNNKSGKTLSGRIVSILLPASFLCGIMINHSYGQADDNSYYIPESKESPVVSGKGISEREEITYVDLGNNNLTEIPSAIFEMSGLEVLDLNDNDITSIPSDIRKLFNLRTFIIGDNDITELPEEISRLLRLTEIRLPYEKWWYKAGDVKRLTRARVVLY